MQIVKRKLGKRKIPKLPNALPTSIAAMRNPLGLETLAWHPAFTKFTGLEIEVRKPTSKSVNIPAEMLPNYSTTCVDKHGRAVNGLANLDLVRTSEERFKAAMLAAIEKNPNGILAKQFAAKLEREAAMIAAKQEERFVPARLIRDGVCTKPLSRFERTMAEIDRNNAFADDLQWHMFRAYGIVAGSERSIATYQHDQEAVLAAKYYVPLVKRVELD